MAVVGECRAMLRLLPAADELLEAGAALGRHHERDGGSIGARDGQHPPAGSSAVSHSQRRM